MLQLPLFSATAVPTVIVIPPTVSDTVTVLPAVDDPTSFTPPPDRPVMVRIDGLSMVEVEAEAEAGEFR